MPAPHTVFRRDPFTWLSYGMIAYFAYVEAVLGPLMPFLRAELHLNYTMAGVHFSLFALGVVTSGFFADRIAGQWGRRAAWLGGGAGMAAGMILLALAKAAIFTIAAAWVMGFFGGVMFIIVQAAIADHHPRFRTVSLTEANIAASLSVTLEPLFIGLFVQWGLGWRSTLWIIAGSFLFVVWRTRHIPITTQPRHPADTPAPAGKKLPLTFWLYWLVLFFGVAAEWCVAFWGAEFLQIDPELSKTVAVSLMSTFFAAAVLARFSASRLAHRFSAQILLIAAVGLASIGFFPFWLSTPTIVTVGGFFILGFGIANFYPLALSLAMGTVPHRADIASARITIGTGAAVFLLPLTLGGIADQIGIERAFGIVGALLVSILAITLLANQKMATHSA